MRYLLFIALIIAGNTFANTDPVADKNSIVIAGNARFTILTPQLIRMEFSKSGQFEDNASLLFINRHLPTPEFTQNVSGNTQTIRTQNLQLTYINDGQSFNEKNLHIRVVADKKTIADWQPGTVDDKNLKGTMRTLDQTNGWDAAAKMEDGIISRNGWALIDDSQNNLFDGNSDWNWVAPREHKIIDWYFFGYGKQYKQALYDFTQVAGKIPLPPKYALGYWWSRYWIYNDGELRDLVKNFRDFHIPLDVLIIDMDWHETYGFSANNLQRDSQGELKGWTGYTWNKQLFPDPQQFIQWTNNAHLKTALNLHPASGVPTMEEKHAEFSQQYYGKNTSEYIPFNISEKKWAQIYFDTLLKPMEDWGIDFWWLDWQQYLQDKHIPNLSMTWWLNYAFFSTMEKSGKRPMIFHRWGGLGNHRYPIGFSGDAATNWETLDFETWFTATAANVGYAYWSHDIGGHVSNGQPTDGELYLRWIQFGALSPILRTHSSKISLIERRPWMFPQHFFAMRDAIKFRYALAPYIYSAAHKTFETGISFVHPLYYENPDNELAYSYKNEYFFGDDIIAAPVTTPIDKTTKLAEKKLWLPAGNWFDFSAGSLLKGGSETVRHYALDEIPMFVKAGSIIPMNPEVESLQQPAATQILTIIPGGNGTTELYSDDENSSAYQRGEFSKRKITSREINKNTLEIMIEPREGFYKSMQGEQQFDIKLPNRTLPTQVHINDKIMNLPLDYLNTELASLIHLPPFGTDQRIKITIEFAQTLAQQNALFNGNKGFLQRMKTATETLKYASALSDWGGTLPNDVYRAGNIVNQLNYTPKQAAQSMTELNQLKQDMPQILTNIPNIPAEITRPLIEFLELDLKK